MEYQKITNLLGNTSDKVPRFITKKWIEVSDQSGGTYNVNKQIRFTTSMLRSDLCDFSHAYVVTGKITVTAPNVAEYDKKLAFENNGPFVSCISKINDTLIENAEDLDIVMSMYNLVQCSRNYRKTTGSLWNTYRDEPNSGFDGGGNNIINYSFKNSESFDYKTSITGKLEGNNAEKGDVKIFMPLKYLRNFWRILDMLLINCEVSLTLTWSENCVLTSKATRDAFAAQEGNTAVAGINNPTNAAFKITDCKLHVPVVTLSAENDNKLLEQLIT